MDHDEALERMEIAAAEPDGLERLMAGDTPGAAEVAGHLAGCPACVDELARIGRTASIVRQVVSAEPDPALRDRTLALVRAVGRDRSGQPEIAAIPSSSPAVPVAGTTVLGSDVPHPATRRRPRARWLAAIAAALLLVGVLGFAAGGRLAGAGPSAPDEVAVLGAAAQVALDVAARPDAQAVALEPVAGGDASGKVAFSPGSGALVVVANGLPSAPAGMEYGCWVEVDGSRRRLGEMYGAGDLQAWSGQADGLADLPIGTTFGVSLVPTAGGAGLPVLTGSL